MYMLTTLVLVGGLQAAAPVDAPVPASVDAETALATFRGTVGAVNAGDRARYLDNLNPWTCDPDPRFVDAPIRSTQQATEFGTIRTQTYRTVVSADEPLEVTLVDLGVWFRTDPGGAAAVDADHGTYEHLVVMRKRGGMWTLAVRTPLHGQRCVHAPPQPILDPTFVRCRDEHYTAKFRCDQTCDDSAEECAACITSARCTLLACLRMDPQQANCAED